MTDRLLAHRPKWLGRLAMWWYKHDGLPIPRSWMPHVLGLALGRRGHRLIRD